MWSNYFICYYAFNKPLIRDLFLYLETSNNEPKRTLDHENRSPSHKYSSLAAALRFLSSHNNKMHHYVWNGGLDVITFFSFPLAPTVLAIMRSSVCVEWATMQTTSAETTGVKCSHILENLSPTGISLLRWLSVCLSVVKDWPHFEQKCTIVSLIGN